MNRIEREQKNKEKIIAQLAKIDACNNIIDQMTAFFPKWYLGFDVKSSTLCDLYNNYLRIRRAKI